MRFNEISQQINEAPRSRFKQAAKGITSRVFSNLPGGRALALNWAARADLDATINATYEEFSQFLGQRDKSYKQATGRDLKDYLKKKSVEFSNKQTIPDGLLQTSQLDQWITRVVFEAVSGIKDTETNGDAIPPERAKSRARELFGRAIDITGRGGDQDQSSEQEPPEVDPPQPDDEPEPEDDASPDDPQQDDEPEDEAVVIDLPDRVFVRTDDGFAIWQDGEWRDQMNGDPVDPPQSVVDIARIIMKSGEDSDLPNGVGVVSRSGREFIRQDGEWQNSDGEALPDDESKFVNKYITKNSTVGDEESQADDDTGEPEQMEDVVVSDSDGNEYYWAGAQWINVTNNRIARRNQRDELNQQVPDKVESRDDIPVGTKVRLDDEVYTWRGVQWVSERGRIARRTIQNELDQKVIQQ